MGLQDLQEFIETSCPKAAINVDLDKVAWRKRGGGKNRMPTGQIVPLFVVLDAESCLHRLYGGSFTDWVCGGQWNQAYQFVAALSNAARCLNIELVVFFNGSLEKDRMQSWSQDQMICKGNVRNILGHIQRKGVPPPKAWFTPPVGVEQCLRLALQDCGIRVQQTIKDHHREVMSYCRGNVFHGIIGHSADYIVFDPPRYFSSHTLKLSRDGRVITTTQFLLDEVAKHLEISQSSLPLVATLLGNHILTEEDVSTFQWRLLEPDQSDSEFKISRVHLPPGGTIIPAIAKYVRELVDPEDLDEIAKFVFRSARGDPAELKQRLKDSVTYFRSASRNGGRGVMHQRAQKKTQQEEAKTDDETKGDEDSQAKDETNVKEEESSGDDTSLTSEDENKDSDADLVDGIKNLKIEEKKNGIPPLMQTTIRHSDIATPPIPTVGADVMRIAHHRHMMGLLHPSILQILTHGEIQIPISIEDDHQLPPVPGIYQQLRQNIYGILFSVANTNQKRRILIKEWWASKGKLLFTPEIAEAFSFNDWQVPPLQQLWLGREPEDKNRRMRAFLSCVRCDTPSMLNQNFVPRHALFMCCILRYLMQFPTPLLRRYEVDAFLATAVSPMLHNPYLIQDVETPTLTQRGLLLASLFMRGVETAMMANDACGEPVPAMVAAPWHYFDGKLFQIKLAIATRDGSNLVQLCEGRVDQVAKVERMRQAIMEGCNYNVAKTPFPPPPPEMSSGFAFMGGYSNMNPPKPPSYGGNFSPQWDHNANRPPSMMYQHPPTSFAQLKVAGYTVGNWAGGDFGGHGYQTRGQKGKGYGGMWFGGGGDASNTKNFY
ncbi:constitutive coactivator of PPAR-gamma-like protein 1 homolog [Styela clava]